MSRLSATFAILVLLASPALADCPAERPIARSVVDYGPARTCASKFKVRLVCPRDEALACDYEFVYPCPPRPLKLACFTAAEIEAAQRE